MTTFISFMTLLVLLVIPACCSAVEIVPFQIRNQNPLIRIFGLPALADARVLPTGSYSAGLMFDLASSYVAAHTSTESLLLDGESYQTNLIVRRGLPHGFEAGFELSWLAYGGGTADGFIQDWHRFFGLPQGGRDHSPNNRLRYRYDKNGVPQLAINDHHAGLGDLMFTGGWQIAGDGVTPQAAALRMAVKIPTGDSRILAGSGGTDLSLWLVGRSDHSFSQGHATLYSAAGGVYLSPGDLLPDQQRHWVAFGSVGAGWSPWEVISFVVQLDASTPFYHGSSLATLSGNPVGLLMGGALALGEKTRLELGVVEDLTVGTWPDVTFHLGLTHQF
jgi:Protein of unknown function (DUF3187)